MTAHRPLLILLALCTMLAVSAQAQPAAVATDRAAAPAWQTPATSRADHAVASTATADLRHATAAAVPSRTSFTTAGSVVVLADGIVADARLAPVPPPAAGFQYER